MRFLLVVLAVVLVSCTKSVVRDADEETPQSTQTPPPSVPSFDASAMDQTLRNAISSGEVVGLAALVFDEGQVVYQGTFGHRDREADLPVTLDTVFRIHSMTKPITAAIILDLSEDGLLNLDDPVAKYIPELANMQVLSADENQQPILLPQKTPMTLKDLLLHRAGLGYGIFGDTNPVEALYSKAGLFEPSEDLETKMAKLSQLPLIVQPGFGWYYSYSMDVLGRVAEIVTKQKLGDIMAERIFQPLGMSQTGFYIQPDQKDRFAVLYQEVEDGSFIPFPDDDSEAYHENAKYQSGGGGLVSTIGDYAKFAQLLLDGGIYNNHRVLNEETVSMMMSDQMDPDDIFMFPWLGGETNASFGYGGSVQIATTQKQVEKSGKAEGHYGWSGLARPTFWVDPPNNAFGIIMLQYLTPDDPEIHDRFRSLAYAQTRDPYQSPAY